MLLSFLRVVFYFIFSPSFQGGLIGGGLLGLDNDGGYVNYDNESRGTESGWSNAFESEMGRDADELEEEDTLPEVELPQEQTALEIEKTEQRAHNLLNMFCLTNIPCFVLSSFFLRFL